MAGKIYTGSSKIYWKDTLPIPFDHTFLFYDGDGNLSTTDDQRLIQALPDGETGRLVIFNDLDAAATDDFDLDTNNDGLADISPSTLNLKEVTSLNSDALTNWNALVSKAKSLGTVLNFVETDTIFTYNEFVANCNTITNTLLASRGTSLIANLPTNLDTSISISSIPGYNVILDSVGNDNIQTSGTESTTIFRYRGGQDVITVELGDTLIVSDDTTVLGNATIILKGYGSEDISKIQIGKNLELRNADTGELVVLIKDHFTATSTISTLKFSDGSIITSTEFLTVLSAQDLTKTLVSTILNWSANIISEFFATSTTLDPLIIDLDNDGFSITGENHIYFDLDNDQFAEAVSWNADAGDGFLVRDLNSNGSIDGIQEMFGNSITDGFTALRAYDSNGDGLISSLDTVWSTLQIWKDENLDGQTFASELYTLSSLGITSISVGLASIDPTNVSGGVGAAGQITDRSLVTTNSGVLTIGNAEFIINQRNSDYIGNNTFDLVTYALPDKRGYSNMMSLRDALSVSTSDEIAATNDLDTLREKFEYLSVQDIGTFFLNYSTNADLFERAMFQWAGIVNVAANSRGNYLSDARIVEFMEEFFGSNFIGKDSGTGIPGLVQAQELEELWYGSYQSNIIGMLQNLKSGIFSQMAAGSLFNGIYYDQNSDIVKIIADGNLTFNATALEALEDAAASLSTNALKQEFWIGVIDYVRSMSAFAEGTTSLYDNYIKLGSSDITALDSAIKASTSNNYDLEDIEYKHQNPTGESRIGTSSDDSYMDSGTIVGFTVYDDTIYGLGGQDYLSGGGGNDTLYANTADQSLSDSKIDRLFGGDGNDILYADASGDILYGGNGNDHLIGSTGNDHLVDTDSSGGGQNLLEGGAGDDSYYTAQPYGTIFINDVSGTDTLKPGHDAALVGGSVVDNTGSIYYYQLSNLTFKRSGNEDLLITGVRSGGGFSVTIANEFSALGNMSGAGIEYIKLYPTGSGGTAYNLDLKNYLSAYTGTIQTVGTAADDVINGILTASTNDNIMAGAGNDVVHGDAGNDLIDGQDGNDTIYGDAGNDELYGGTGTNYLDGGDGDDLLYGTYGIDTIYGGTGNDSITDNSATSGDKLYGGDGNDTIFTSGGAKTVDGGAGNDTMTGGGGNTTYIYSSGNDTISDADGADTIVMPSGATPNDIVKPVQISGTNDLYIGFTGSLSGSITIKNWFLGNTYKIETITFDDGFTLKLNRDSDGFWATDTSGNDTVTLGSTTRYLVATAGNDTINGDANDNIVWAGSGDDIVSGSYGEDVLHGASGNDQISGNDGDDKLWGGDGNDLLDGGQGSDFLSGGNGIDTLSYASATAGVTVNLLISSGQNTINSGIDIISGFENLTGSGYSDTFTGDDGANVILGLNGNDIISGGAGNDTIEGGLGDDILVGGADTDTLSYSTATLGVTVNLSLASSQNTVNAGMDTISGFENLIGSAFNDTLTGNNGNNVIEGGAGNDIMNGGSGAGDTVSYEHAAGGVTVNLALTTAQDTGGAGIDTISNFENILGSIYNDVMQGNSSINRIDGGAGNDLIYAVAGNDVIIGGDGTDTVSFELVSAGVTALLATTAVQNTGGAASLSLRSLEYIIGSNYDDNFTGSQYSNNFQGGSGNDTLRGEAGADTLNGGTGLDRLYGGSGNDILTGGADADIFMFDTATLGSIDTITDFTTSQGDKLDISNILFGYNAATSAIDDFISFTTSGGNTNVFVDRDGAGATYSAQSIASLSGVTGLDADVMLSNGNLIA